MRRQRLKSEVRPQPRKSIAANLQGFGGGTALDSSRSICFGPLRLSEDLAFTAAAARVAIQHSHPPLLRSNHILDRKICTISCSFDCIIIFTRICDRACEYP